VVFQNLADGARKVSDQKITYRYSHAFKQKVVSEVESGKLTRQEARRVYGIAGGRTINDWIRLLGKNYLLNKVVRIEMKDEKNRIKELEREKRQLESALAQEHIKNITLEALIDCVEEHFQIDVKKNFGNKPLKKPS
jgi:transposase-like protein